MRLSWNCRWLEKNVCMILISPSVSYIHRSELMGLRHPKLGGCCELWVGIGDVKGENRFYRMIQRPKNGGLKSIPRENLQWFWTCDLWVLSQSHYRLPTELFDKRRRKYPHLRVCSYGWLLVMHVYAVLCSVEARVCCIRKLTNGAGLNLSTPRLSFINLTGD